MIYNAQKNRTVLKPCVTKQNRAYVLACASYSDVIVRATSAEAYVDA